MLKGRSGGAHTKDMPPHDLYIKTHCMCVCATSEVGIARASESPSLPHISPSNDMTGDSCLPLKGAIDGSGHQKLESHPIRLGKFGLGGLLISMVNLASL